MRFRLANTGSQQMYDSIGRGMQALFSLPMLRAQAAEEAQNAAMKQALLGAQIDEQRAKADEQRDTLQRRSLGEMLKSAALQNRVPLHQLDEFTDFAQTGKLLPKYDLPSDLAGPTMPQPQYADPDVVAKIMQTLGLTQQALTVGDKSVENIAKATGAYQDQGITDSAVAAAGRGDDMAMSRLNAIRGKKEFTPFAAVGNTGTALNQVTGQQGISNAGLRALFGDVQGANILRDKAAASSSYASAGASRALEQQRRDELERGKRTGNLQIVTGPNGEITVVDKFSRTAEPVLGADGKPVVKGTAGGGGKPMTEGQAKANLFGGRMIESDRVLNEMEASGVFRPGTLKSLAEGVGGSIPIIGDSLREGASAATNWTQSAKQQQVDQARRDFINAVLRRESGAVISEAEFANADKQYFPQIGDSKAVLDQKRRNRKIAATLMLQEVPEAHRYKGAVPAQAGAPAGPEGSWSAQPAPAGWSIQRVN